MIEGPDEMRPVDGAEEPFLSRWSRRKDESRRQVAEPAPAPAPDRKPDAEGSAPELPPVEELTPESDYRAFFHPRVGEDVRRAALKKLFSDPHFNVMDGLDVYIDDYSKTEPIPAAMMAQLRQAQNIFEWAKSLVEEPGKGVPPHAARPATDSGLPPEAAASVVAAAPEASDPPAERPKEGPADA